MYNTWYLEQKHVSKEYLFAYLCIYIYIYAHTCYLGHMKGHTYIYIYTCIYTYTRIYIYIHISICHFKTKKVFYMNTCIDK